jgi:integrase
MDIMHTQQSGIPDAWEELLTEYFFARNLRPDTEWSYKKVVRGFVRYFPNHTFPATINQRDVLGWRRHILREKKQSTHTWNNKITHLRALLNFAMQEEMVQINKNPFNGCSVQKDRKKKKTLEKKQITAIYLLMQQLDAEGDKVRFVQGKVSALYPAWYWLTVLDTLRYTGMRFNQLLHLKLAHVNVDEGFIDLHLEGSKTHREWRIPIVSSLRPGLRHLICEAERYGAEPVDYLFDVNRYIYGVNRRYEYSEKSAFQKIRSFFRRLSDKLGYHVTPHRFRHTLATELMKSPDRNLHMVKDLLGHRNVNTTMEYVGLKLDVVGEALERELRVYTDGRKKNSDVLRE